MQITTSYDSISKQVLNQATGELEWKQFKEVKERKRVKGGFKMVYKSYDEATINIITSTLDLKILIYIRDLFTYARTENVLSKIDIAKAMEVSQPKVSTIIKKMVDTNLLMRVSRGTYRLNPFMYLPFRANGEELQDEWNNLLSRK